MRTRLLRIEQVERNRDLVLAAAKRVFLAKGYVGASLDAIAEEAGFSKGVVYSQFDSKADLFFALLERRIEERAAQNERIAAELSGAACVSELIRLAERAAAAEPEWSLLVIEFRVHAARDPELNRRYAEAHARTIERFARVLSGVLADRAGATFPFDARTLAEVILTLGAGVALERAANPDAVPRQVLEHVILGAVDAGADGKRRAATTGPTRRTRR